MPGCFLHSWAVLFCSCWLQSSFGLGGVHHCVLRILASLSTRRQLNFFQCLSLVSRNALVDRSSLHLLILSMLSLLYGLHSSEGNGGRRKRNLDHPQTWDLRSPRVHPCKPWFPLVIFRPYHPFTLVAISNFWAVKSIRQTQKVLYTSSQTLAEYTYYIQG